VAYARVLVANGRVKMIAMKLLGPSHFLADANQAYGRQQTTLQEYRRAMKQISYMMQHDVTYDERDNQKQLLKARTTAHKRNLVLQNKRALGQQTVATAEENGTLMRANARL